MNQLWEVSIPMKALGTRANYLHSIPSWQEVGGDTKKHVNNDAFFFPYIYSKPYVYQHTCLNSYVNLTHNLHEYIKSSRC